MLTLIIDDKLRVEALLINQSDIFKVFPVLLNMFLVILRFPLIFIIIASLLSDKLIGGEACLKINEDSSEDKQQSHSL
ncbi:hypothetical protein C0J00_03895 [Streptococcus pluranimalium]|uniref:Uncharacterized protein n=1 Tax=Streptococcus pluranimalium TaxID=82348 RepID=A0A2L0D3Z5_9STRE|nr:hypothetical protein C0J00_03895 [Streptococcus pluranimalium]